MKVLVVNDYATPNAGVEVMVQTLCNGLRAKGHWVHVVASRAKFDSQNCIADTMCFGTSQRLQALSSTWNPSAQQAVRQAIKKFKPDIVHVHMFLWQLSPSILPPLRHMPSIYHIHTYKPICPNGRKTLPDGQGCSSSPGLACLRSGCLTPQTWVTMMAQQRLWRRNQSVFDRFVTVSRIMQQRLEREGISPCRVIANGCPVRPARPALGGSPVIAYAGRLAPEKGVDVLLRAFARVLSIVPRAQLRIAGSGPLTQDLKSLARRLGVIEHTHFLGGLDRATLERELDSAWFQVVPSVWEEPFGLVAIEAMMRGTAVIASTAGGLSEIVRQHETGLLVPANQPAELASAMSQLAENLQLCESMGDKGRRVALREYSAEEHCERVLAVYEELIWATPSAARHVHPASIPSRT